MCLYRVSYNDMYVLEHTYMWVVEYDTKHVAFPHLGPRVFHLLLTVRMWMGGFMSDVVTLVKMHTQMFYIFSAENF